LLLSRQFCAFIDAIFAFMEAIFATAGFTQPKIYRTYNNTYRKSQTQKISFFCKKTNLVGLLAALLVQLNQLLLTWTGLDSQVKASKNIKSGLCGVFTDPDPPGAEPCRLKCLSSSEKDPDHDSLRRVKLSISLRWFRQEAFYCFYI
jgi:hypothetical protein